MDDHTAALADALGALIWQVGATGALGELVEQLFDVGRDHQALDLLRVLADPVPREQLGRLAQARLDACHDGRGPVATWAAAALLDDGARPTDGDEEATVALLEEVLDLARTRSVGLRDGTVAVLAARAPAAGRPDLADALRAVGEPTEGGPSPAATAPSRQRPRRPMPDHRVDVALAFDRRIAPVAQVAMSSIARTTPGVVFHVAVRSVSDAEVESLADLLEAPIFAHHVDGLDHGGARSLDHIGSPSSLDRMVLPDILGDLDRAIYVDADLVATTDLAPLSERDLGRASVAARPIRHGPASIGDMVDRRHRGLPGPTGEVLRSWVRDDGVASDAGLLNAGVLVLDLSALRRDHRLASVRSLMSACGLDDQDGLCLLAGGRFAPLERRWNALVAMDHVPKPAILHWAGVHKPWTHLGTPCSSTWWHQARLLAERAPLVWPIPGIDADGRMPAVQ